MYEPVLVLASVWWVLFCAAVGLTLGSFLNVVIYRVPRGISTTFPRWSFCPSCTARIRWYDNLPVLSYLRLGGRCRACGAVISPRYPVIELLTAVVTLVLLDVFCVAKLREGLYPGSLGITEQLWTDWPILLAHVLLFVCLLGMSVIDLEYYFIDIRFTNFAALMGFILHAIWTPISSNEWLRPGPTTGAVTLAAAAVLGMTWLALGIAFRRDRGTDGPREKGEEGAGESPSSETLVGEQGIPTNESERGETPDADSAVSPSPAPSPAPPTQPSVLSPQSSPPSRLPVWLALLLFLGVIVALGGDLLTAEGRWGASWRLLVPLVVLFGFVVGGAAPVRESDTDIVSAIESEKGSARAVVLQELLLLAPAILSGAVILWLCLTNPGFDRRVTELVHWQAHGSWRPFQGMATAASGFVIGGAIGWAVRILFTLVLGREAFGMGDIHLMAAAGCVAGWPVVVLGFVLTCFLALLGWVVTLPFKRTRAIPLVPWLSLAFMAVVIFLEPLVRWGPVENVLVLVELLSHNSQAR